jgi:subtilisin family serine protease
MAGFSSQGPTDVDRRVKPDVVAPGVNVLSSIPRSYCGGDPCFAFFSGTSMSSPHLAGSAAVVRQQHPSWTAAQVRSAIVNTADEGSLTSYKDGSTIVTDPNIIGAGRENLAEAVKATVLLDPVSVSFGRIPSGSGQSRSATITASGFSTGVLTVEITGPEAARFTASVTGSTITVTGMATKGQDPGGYDATLRVKLNDVEVAHAVLFYEIG